MQVETDAEDQSITQLGVPADLRQAPQESGYRSRETSAAVHAW